MSDKPKPTDESKEDKAAPPEKSGGMATETKVGLLLVLVLLCAFGFMVWQKWNRAQQAAEKSGGKKKAVVSNDNGVKKTPPPPDVDDDQPPEQALEPNPVATPNEKKHGMTVIPVNGTRTVDPFGETTTEEVAAPKGSTISDPHNESDPHNNALPTLEIGAAQKSAQKIPEEFDPFDPSKHQPAEPTSVPKKTADAGANDPFGEWEADAKDKEETPIAAETPKLPAEQDDPFAPEPSQAKAPALTLEAPEASNSGGPFPGPTDGGHPLDTAAESGENVASDPFGEHPLEAAQEPNPAAKSNPLFDVPANDETAPELTTEAAPQLKSSYHEPQPLLDPVPKDDRLGGFEEVTSGHATAGSTTQIEASPEFPGVRSNQSDPVFGDAPARISAASRNEPQEFFPQRHSLAPEPAADNSVSAYKVQAKDNYWSISRKVYGTSRYYRALAMYNRKRISDPQKMRAGMQILVPPAKVLESSFPELFPQKSARVQQVGGETAGLTNDLQGNPVFVVGKGDTLSEIAQKHLGRSSRWIQIFALNRDKLSNPNDLKIGMSLKLPQDASRVKISAGDAGSPLR